MQIWNVFRKHIRHHRSRYMRNVVICFAKWNKAKRTQTICWTRPQIEWLMAHLTGENIKHLQLLLTVWIFFWSSFCLRSFLFIQIFRFCVMINDIGQQIMATRIPSRNNSHYKIRGEENENNDFATTQSNSTLIWLIGWLATKPNINCNSINLLIVFENDFRFSSQSVKLIRFRSWIFE